VESQVGSGAWSRAVARASAWPRAALRSLEPAPPPVAADARSAARRRAVARIVNVLALEAGALAYVTTVSSLGPTGLLSFVDDNAAPPEFRRLLLGVSLGTAGAVRLGATFAVTRFPRAEERLGRLASLLALALVVWALPALYVRQTFAKSELLLVALVGGLALALDHTTRSALGALGASVQRLRAAARRLPAWLPALLAGALIGAAWLFAAAGSLRLHAKMLTSNLDLGIYDNVFFNTLHGRTGVGLGHTYFAEHGELLLYALLPLYAWRPGAETLLVVQATLVTGAAVPLYLLARRWLDSAYQALAFAVVYLSLPTVHGALFYDFHFLPLSAFFLFWAAYFFARRARVAFWGAVVLAMSCREDVALGLSLVGLGFAAFGRSRRTMLPLAILGAVWFGLVKFVWMRHFGAESFTGYYDALIPRGSSGFGAVLRTLLSNPLYSLQRIATEDKLLLGLHLFAPLAFLPIRQWRTLPLLVPGAVVVGLATNRPAVTQVHFHYAMHLVPYALIASVAALAARPRAARAPLVLAMLVASSVLTVHFGALLGERFRAGFHEVSFQWGPEDTRRRNAFLALAARIPGDASVAAGEHEGPHLARRARLLTVKDGLSDARFVIYSTRSLRWGGREPIEEALKRGSYGALATKDDFALLERGASTTKNQDALRQLGKK
jgi:uncharacterized membrane protein